MKTIISLLAVLLSVLVCNGQTDATGEGTQRVKKSRCAKAFFDLSTGLNNNGGLLGLGADYHVTEDISINAGLGAITSWGYKFYLGTKFYFKPCHKGWAIGCGATYSTGIPSYTTKMETMQGGSELVELRLLPQTNVMASAYHHWRLGRNKNRMYLQLGWSIPVATEKFRQISGNALTVNSASVLKFLAPGGLIVGLGFSFGG